MQSYIIIINIIVCLLLTTTTASILKLFTYNCPCGPLVCPQGPRIGPCGPVAIPLYKPVPHGEPYKFLFQYDYNKIANTSAEPDMSVVTIHLFKGNQTESYDLKNGSGSLLSSSLFDKSLPVTIFVYGFLTELTSPIARGIKSALLNKGGMNVLVLNTLGYIQYNYVAAITNVQFIGRGLGVFLSQLVAGGVPASNIHLIGHSLGAHISGFAGKNFQGLNGSKINRISGLDPAGPCYYSAPNEYRLYKTDASFVDVIHSDAGDFGLDDSVGHVDFFPNGGKTQPNKLLSLMGSHNMSWLYYASSLAEPTGFVGVQCSGFWEYLFNRCGNNPKAYMGYGASPSDAFGNYYLLASPKSPYYMREDGLNPANLFSVFFGQLFS